MAKDAQLFTSRWLLLAGVVCAVLAAVVVNLYLGSIKSQYESGTFHVVQVTRDVPPNGKVTQEDVRQVPVPPGFEEAFKQAFKGRDDMNFFIGGKPCRRRLNQGDILFYADFVDVQGAPEPVRPPAGYEYMSLPILKDSSPGMQLQPGSFVAVRGRFDVNPGGKQRDFETFTVISCIQAQTLDDSKEPTTSGNYSRVGVFVKREQVKLLSDILGKAEARKLMITLTSMPPGGRAVEPEIDGALVRLVQTGKADAPDLLQP
jgi:hypothetical protein